MNFNRPKGNNLKHGRKSCQYKMLDNIHVLDYISRSEEPLRGKTFDPLIPRLGRRDRLPLNSYIDGIGAGARLGNHGPAYMGSALTRKSTFPGSRLQCISWTIRQTSDLKPTYLSKQTRKALLPSIILINTFQLKYYAFLCYYETVIKPAHNN